MSGPRVLLVANPAPTQLGAHLIEAGSTLGLDVRVVDTREAYRGPAWLRTAAWRLRGHRPLRLAAFSADVLAAIRRHRPDVVLTTGLAPLTLETLAAIGGLKLPRLNFLTDDPWNPVHYAPWFLKGLPAYDLVFSPRRANMDDLTRAGVRRVEYLPFAYSPTAHRYEAADAPEAEALRADVLLAGGGDAERARIVAPLIRAGLSVALYGGYWDRYPETRPYAKGRLDEAGLRKATAAARVCLGLVRRGNRDGHSMRTFEVPAMRGCLIAERTPDHVALFGEAVVYFDDADDVVDATRWLLDHPVERDRLTTRAHAVIQSGGHTYADRLKAMLEAAA